MAKPIEISLVANTRAFSAGTQDAAKALDKVADSLDDLARDSQRQADRTGDNLADGIKDGAKDADSHVERLNKSFRELATEARTESRQAGDDIGKNVKRGTDDAREGIKEVGRESASTAKESAASFDGSAESIGDAFQEVAANAFAGFGPAGLIAGIAAAAGIGLVFSKMEEGAEDTEAFKERVAELAQEFIDTGGQGEASIEGILDRLKDLATATDDVNLADLADAARRSKTDFRDLAEAYAGNAEGIDDLLQKQDDLRDALEEEASAVDTTTDAGIRRYEQIQEQLGGLAQQAEYLYKTRDATNAAAEAEALFLSSGGPELQLKADLVGAVDEAFDGAAGSIENYVNKETGVFDTQAYIDSMNARSQALRDYQTDILSLGLTPEAIAFLNEQGVESASQMLAGYKTAAPGQRDELNRIWTEAGKTNSGEYKKALDTGIPKTFEGPKITSQMDLSGANRALELFAARDRTLTIRARIVDQNGKAVLP